MATKANIINRCACKDARQLLDDIPTCSEFIPIDELDCVPALLALCETGELLINLHGGVFRVHVEHLVASEQHKAFD